MSYLFSDVIKESINKMNFITLHSTSIMKKKSQIPNLIPERSRKGGTNKSKSQQKIGNNKYLSGYR